MHVSQTYACMLQSHTGLCHPRQPKAALGKTWQLNFLNFLLCWEKPNMLHSIVYAMCLNPLVLCQLESSPLSEKQLRKFFFFQGGGCQPVITRGLEWNNAHHTALIYHASRAWMWRNACILVGAYFLSNSFHSNDRKYTSFLADSL